MMSKMSDMLQESPPEHDILFFSEDVDFELDQEEEIRVWIEIIVKKEKKELQLINFIFCSDAYLHELNVEYLDHDTLTDIITFPYSPLPTIEGDIFISLERVKDNAETFHTHFQNELHRVMIHGALHLCGYGDKTPAEKKIMTAKEDEALLLLEL